MSGKGKKYDGLDPEDGVEMKLRYDLIPPEVLEHLARVFTHGAVKYGENQWQTVSPFYTRYYGAAERHIQADRMGEAVDPLSGELHLAHAFWNIGALLWRRILEMKAKKLVEDELENVREQIGPMFEKYGEEEL